LRGSAALALSSGTEGPQLHVPSWSAISVHAAASVAAPFFGYRRAIWQGLRCEAAMRACTSNNVNATRATCTGAMRGRARVHAGLFTKVHYNTIHFETGRALTAAHVWLHRQRMSCVWHSVCSAEIVGCAVLCGITLSHAWCYGFVLSLHARLQWRMNWGTCVLIAASCGRSRAWSCQGFAEHRCTAAAVEFSSMLLIDVCSWHASMQACDLPFV